MQLRLHALPTLICWGVTFLKNSRTAAFNRNTVSNLRLALYSLEAMERLRRQTDIAYERSARGALRMYRDRAALDEASAAANRIVAEGLSFRRLSREELIEVEPALEPIAQQLVGAIHYESDETGDAYQYSVALTNYCRRQSVNFRFKSDVSSLEVRSGLVKAVVIGGERLIADRYIVAAGSGSRQLLRSAGISIPVQPVKGYSLTFGGDTETSPLRVPIIDDDYHAAIVPLGGRIRIAGTAEFCGNDLRLEPDRIRNLTQLFKRVLPRVEYDRHAVSVWCGLRPVSVDGVPLIGLTAISNLLVNTGHGHLGWTLAAGSAHLLVELMAGESPRIDPTPYDPCRFA
jgi:D-amino-acid dehydrogenase